MLSVPPTAPAPAGEGSSEQVQYVLKASLNNDVRRFRLSWPSAASGEEIINAICDAVQRSFDLPMAEHCLKYEDDDGDFCTLVKLTVVDYLSSRQGSTLKKVFVCRKEPTADIGASTEPSVSSEATLSQAAPQMSIANEEEEVQAASEGNSQVIGDPMNPQDFQRCHAVLGQLLEVPAQDGNQRKREDISKRLDELYNKLQYGYVATPTSQKVMALVGAIEQQDFASANKIQVELSTADWDKNKNWLMGLKRLLVR